MSTTNTTRTLEDVQDRSVSLSGSRGRTLTSHLLISCRQLLKIIRICRSTLSILILSKGYLGPIPILQSNQINHYRQKILSLVKIISISTILNQQIKKSENSI